MEVKGATLGRRDTQKNDIWYNDTQHNDAWHNEAQHNDKKVTFGQTLV
jgi:hypothetical protein